MAVSSAVRQETVSKIARTSTNVLSMNDVIVSNKYTVHSALGKRGLITVEYCIIDADQPLGHGNICFSSRCRA